jgi:hypothetical protein
MSSSSEYEVRVEQHTGIPLAVVRRRARQQDLSTVVPQACGLVWNVLRGLQFVGAGRNVAVYLDGVINLEVGVEVPAPFVGQGEVVGSATPAGTVATATHIGPYGELHRAHSAIHRWCVAHGRELAGASWEVYGHWRDEWNRDPSLIQTDVFYLLAPQGDAA